MYSVSGLRFVYRVLMLINQSFCRRQKGGAMFYVPGYLARDDIPIYLS